MHEFSPATDRRDRTPPLLEGFCIGGEGIVTADLSDSPSTGDLPATDRRRRRPTATAPSEPRGSASGECVGYGKSLFCVLFRVRQEFILRQAKSTVTGKRGRPKVHPPAPIPAGRKEPLLLM